jgi:hypothetical protein
MIILLRRKRGKSHEGHALLVSGGASRQKRVETTGASTYFHESKLCDKGDKEGVIEFGMVAHGKIDIEATE